MDENIKKLRDAMNFRVADCCYTCRCFFRGTDYDGWRGTCSILDAGDFEVSTLDVCDNYQKRIKPGGG